MQVRIDQHSAFPVIVTLPSRYKLHHAMKEEAALSPKLSPVKEETVSQGFIPSSAESKHQERLVCICRTPFNARRFMIMCQQCSERFHGTCVGISRVEMQLLPYYICIYCEKQLQQEKLSKTSNDVSSMHHDRDSYDDVALDIQKVILSDALDKEEEILEKENMATAAMLISPSPEAATRMAVESERMTSLRKKPTILDEEEGICPICDNDCTCGNMMRYGKRNGIKHQNRFNEKVNVTCHERMLQSPNLETENSAEVNQSKDIEMMEEDASPSMAESLPTDPEALSEVPRILSGAAFQQQPFIDSSSLNTESHSQVSHYSSTVMVSLLPY
jgi:hypothetical protein